MTTTQARILKGYAIRTTGACEPVTLSGANESWREINTAIGARHFDVVSLPGNIDLFVNDEGLIDGSPLNLPLTIVIHQLGGRTAICGDGMFLGVNQRNGDNIALDDVQLEQILTAIKTPPTPDVVAALAQTLAPMRAYLEATRS